jgi:competence protein ComEC
MLAWILAFAVGVLALPLCRTLPPWQLIMTILVWSLGIYALLFLLKIKKPWLHCLAKLFLALTLGFAYAFYHAHTLLSWSLPSELEGKKISIQGYIASLPKVDLHHISFTFATTKIATFPIKTKILLNWYNDYPQYPLLKVGDSWQLEVILKKPHSTANPGAFDYEAYLFENQIRATGYVISIKTNHATIQKNNLLFINILRQKVKEKVEDTLKNQPCSAFIKTLVTGDQSGISANEWQIFRRTGTIHFMAIAGLHIGFVAGLLFLLGKLLWRVRSRLSLLLPANEAGAILAMLGAMLYSALAGFSIPTERACIMILVFMSAMLLRRNLAGWHAFCISLLLVILLDPLVGLTTGFWLSFGAVALIIYTLSARLKPTNKYLKFLRLQWTLTLGLLPLTLLLFQQAPLISLLGNLLAVPWIGLIVIPLSLSGALFLFIFSPLGKILLILACRAMQLIWFWLQWLASLSIASWQHNIFNFWILGFALAAVLLFLAPRALPARWLGLLLLTPLLFYKPPHPQNGEIWFTLLDVGQGLATVVQTQNHILVYDTGPKFNDNSDAGSNIVLPFLSTLGANQLDMLVVSHADTDHSGGAQSILNTIQVKQIATGAPELFPKFNPSYCLAGQSWQWDGVTFSFLYPFRHIKIKSNENSCVLKISSGENSILLTGDIEAPIEHLIVQEESTLLKTSILQVPHHGSDSSSTSAFVNATSPQYAIFATGYRNRFHFPSKSIVDRYLASGSILENSAQTGAITFKFNAKSGILRPEIYRHKEQRFWHEN